MKCFLDLRKILHPLSCVLIKRQSCSCERCAESFLPSLLCFSTISHPCHTVFLSPYFLTLFLPPFHQPFTDSNTHVITQLSLFLPLMSATEVRVWVFCPRATQQRFTMTVTPALPATLDPELAGSSGLLAHHDNGTAVITCSGTCYTFSHALRDS